MSQAVIGALRVNLGLDSAQFTSGLKTAHSQLRSVGSGLQKVGAAIAAVGAVVAVAIRGQLNAIDELAKTSDRIGITVEAMSRLQHAANLSDVATGTLQRSLQGLASGLRLNEQRFRDLGIRTRDASGQFRPLESILGDVADVIAATPEGVERTALAIQLLGTRGAELLPMLRGGSEGLREMGAEADRLGLTISTRTARQVEAFNDNLTRLRAQFTGLVRQVAAALVPTLERLSNAVVAVAQTFQGLSTEQQEFAAMAAGLALVVGPAIIAVGALVRSLAALRVALVALAGPAGVVVAGIALAAAAFVAYRRQAGEAGGAIEDVRDAQAALNDAMGVFHESAAPAAASEALGYARELERQARSALAAAEAELTLLETRREAGAALLAQNRLTRDRSGYGDAMDENVIAARARVEELRDAIRQAQNAISDIGLIELGQGARSAAFDLATIVVETDELEDVLRRVGGQATQLTDTELPDLTAALGELERQTYEVRGAFEGAFVGILTGTRGAREAIATLLQDLARLAAQSAFRGLVSGLNIGGGGGLAGLGSLLFGGLAGRRAEGGPVMPARAYLVGERGPELFVPGAGGQIVPNDALAGGQVVVRLDLRSDLLDARVADVAGPVAVEVVRGYDRALPERMQQIAADPRRIGGG